MKKSKTSVIGIITSGGDCPGLNAAIRGVARTAIGEYGIKTLGVFDGFRGLVENRTMELDSYLISGLLTRGGTILGTSRDKPFKMPMGGKALDMTSAAVENARRLQIDCLVCLGGGGTQKNALHMHREGGLNVLTLPKTIDNDVAGTDVSFGFDTAMSVATEAIDRLHSTATSHHRIIVVEIMGHNAGWLTLGAGISGGADVILIPEIPYNPEIVAWHLSERRKSGKKFSIIAIAEGALSVEEARAQEREAAKAAKAAKGGEKSRPGTKEKGKSKAESKGKGEEPEPITQPKDDHLPGPRLVQEPKASRLARQLQQMTGVEARVTSLGHVVRGGTPTPNDRLLCTRLGVKAAELLAEGVYNVMVAVKGGECVPVPLEKVAGFKKTVPPDHPWVQTARLVGTCLGDR